MVVLGAVMGGLVPFLMLRWMKSEHIEMAGLTDHTRDTFAMRIEPALPVLILIGAGFGAAFMFWFYIRFSLTRFQHVNDKAEQPPRES